MKQHGKILVSLLAAFALVAAAVGFALSAGGGGGGKDHDEAEARGAGHEMREALEKHPGLNKQRMMPLAYLSEKVAQADGDPEATGEIQNGPNQESYDQRAYPRQVIDPAQQKQSARAAEQAVERATTPEGRAALARSIQASDSADAAAPGTWEPVGPNTGQVVEEATYTGKPAHVSGRTTALATPTTSCTAASCTLYAGTAGGGLWKTTNALAATPTWASVGANLPSNAIGSITISPDNSTLYVGTGEPNGSSDSEAGLGLFKSTDGGTSFTKVSTKVLAGDFTLNRSVGAIAVDPANPQHLLVGTAVARHGSSSVNGGRYTPPGAAQIGLYETTNGGTSWTLSLSESADAGDPSSPNGGDFFRGGISKILFDPTHPNVAYASMFDYGLYRATLVSGVLTWTRVYSISSPGAAATSSTNRIEFATAALPGGNTRIYLGDATKFGAVSGLLRTDDATASTPAWTLLSDPAKGTPGYGSYNFCHGQCSYDMVVSSPPGLPDEVFLSGSMNYDELIAFGAPGNGRSNGRAVVRSEDAGAHFTDMTQDASDNGLHPDQHGLVFVNTPGVETFFSASDGGVVRQSGPYVNGSAACATRGLSGVDLVDCLQFLAKIPTSNDDRTNLGLQTLQFQSVSVGGNGIVQGGTQDNGTWESDQSGFAETVGGDGGQSTFDPANPAIRMHSYYNPQHDVSFNNGAPDSWDWVSDPFNEASSFYTPLTADPVTSGTVFDGLQHIWRTTDNGGPQAYLDQHCNELTGDFSVTCGDWVTLGGAAGDLSGGNAGNYVVAVERAPSDAGTLWAGTRLGRIFVSSNANAASAPSVTYKRIDLGAGLPQRFPSGIAIDPTNPNHAYISYSGYSAYSPGGHVYDVTYNPATGTATATDLSADLGDQPITDIVYLPATHVLFASTDYGVVTRSTTSSGGWVGTPGLPVVAVYGLTYDSAHNALYAATHGRAVWKTTPAPPTVPPTKVASTTTATAPHKVKAKKRFKVAVTVAAAGTVPTGTVQVFDGSKLIGTGTLVNGKVTVTIAKGLKKKGRHVLTVKYLGSDTVLASQTTVKIKVKAKKKRR